MNLLEMRKEKEKKRAEVRALLAENKIVEAETKMQEVRDLEAKIKIQEEIENAEARELNENGEKRNLDNGKEERTQEEIEEEEIRSFENFCRGEKRALSKANNGAIVPTTIANKIIEKVKELCPIYAMAEIYNVKGTLTIPIYDEETSSIGAAYQGDEFTELTEGTGNFKSVDLTGFVIGTLAKISKSLINNSEIDITSYVVGKVAKSIADFLEKELLEGKTKIKGLVNSTNVITSSTANRVTADDLIDTQMEIPAIYLPNAVWIMNKADLKALRKLKDSDGNYLLNKDIVKGFGYEILGNHVYISENATNIYFGDMKGLSVKLSKQLELTMLNEKYATQYAIGACAFIEADAKITDNQRIVKLVKKTA